MIDTILEEFNLKRSDYSILPIHTGLINSTWKVGVNGDAYILQKINDRVFRHPEDIAFNISEISGYLKDHFPGYLFAGPIKGLHGQSLIYKKGSGYYRLFPFIKESHTIHVVETPEQAYEAARQFGKFTATLNDFDSRQLKTTIPFFHDLSLRYKQFLESLEKGNKDRIHEAAELIGQLKKWVHIKNTYDEIRADPAFKLRVTHHDTKISNILFDKTNNGLCVIDLDTVMPGYFISDVGDMMRTYLSPVSEEEKDYTLISVRKEYYEAIVNGYLSEMDLILTEKEKQCFYYAGAFMIYMQALRFLTDYLNDDIYYGASYPEHNLVRAGNQATLLNQLAKSINQLAD